MSYYVIAPEAQLFETGKDRRVETEALFKQVVKGFCTSGEESFQGGPPWNSNHDYHDEALSWRVFGVIQNPSGFGVFSPVLPRGFKGFG